jgi:hypothetical protein
MTTLDESTQQAIISFIKDNLTIEMYTEVAYDFSEKSQVVQTILYLGDEKISEDSISINIPHED